MKTLHRVITYSARGVFAARRAEAAVRRAIGTRTRQPAITAPPRPGSRNILFITTDQQRYDALGVNGGRYARTPVIDGLAATGINYRAAHVHSAVCMPSRATMLTGQHPRTHGVIANGIPLPEDAPSVAEYLRTQAGYRTALIGKAHFDPHLDPLQRHWENRCAAQRLSGPWHGFEHLELATHGPALGHHYSAWLWQNHPEKVGGFGGVLSGAGGGDTGAPEVAFNPIPREHYHTDWVADRCLAWLQKQPPEQPWFCWMSFPDPHHPFDPPLEEVRKRIDWRDVDLPDGYLAGPARAAAVLADRPRHWLDWYEGRFRNPEGGSTRFVPAKATADQLREVNAMVHVENELIDEACGRVLSWLVASGVDEHTDIFFTSDHGEMQGDFGLLYKGPYHVTSLLRVPLIWRPASRVDAEAIEIENPVGHVDLAPTFCEIAGLPVPEWMEGTTLPVRPKGAAREHVITTFDSQFSEVGMHLRTIYHPPYLCTFYEPSTRDQGGRFRLAWSVWGADTQVPAYDGSEGELYHLENDPQQWRNLWADPHYRSIRNDLIDELRAALPPARQPALKVVAPT